MKRLSFLLLAACCSLLAASQQTQKPPLHGKNWMAVTGKPLAATAGSIIFQKGGNAVDAACAMLAATCTMWDVLSWGGETQALIYNPKTKKVIAINALGVSPTVAPVGETPNAFIAITFFVFGLYMSAWVSPPQLNTSHMVQVAASIAHAASTALPPF